MEDNSTSAIHLKRCLGCEQALPATTEYFHQAKINSDGFRGRCKECRNPDGKRATRRLRQERKNNGLCHNCGLPAIIGHLRCQPCAEFYKIQGREYKQSVHASGLCTNCRRAQPERSDRWLCAVCAEHDREKGRKRRADRIAAGLCYVCGKRPFEGEDHRCPECSEKRERSHRKSDARIRAKVYETYGSQCQCCGEQNVKFLTLDHVNGDGAAERREKRGISGITLMRQLLRLDCPDNYRLLCWNCNLATHIYGVCPHQEKETCRP